MKKNAGFTLVELSIVLVIIGLLIGGILAAQSMIGSTKIQSQARQIQQYDIAMQNFQTNYNSIAGDSNLFNSAGNSTNTGCPYSKGDGIVDSCSSSGTQNDVFDSTETESANVWLDLQNSGHLKDNTTYIAYTVANTNPNLIAAKAIPASKIGTKGSGIILTNEISSMYAFAGQGYYLLANFSYGGIGHQLNLGSASTDPITFALTGAEALAIDSKMDDGVGHTGNILTTEDTAADHSWNSTYHPDNKDVHYVLIIKYLARKQ